MVKISTFPQVGEISTDFRGIGYGGTLTGILQNAQTHNMRNDSWQALYEVAMIETDPQKLRVCVRAAEEAISARLGLLGGQVSRDELVAMRDATSALHTLKREWTRKRPVQA
jgi:hypothetical protein